MASVLGLVSGLMPLLAVAQLPDSLSRLLIPPAQRLSSAIDARHRGDDETARVLLRSIPPNDSLYAQARLTLADLATERDQWAAAVALLRPLLRKPSLRRHDAWLRYAPYRGAVEGFAAGEAAFQEGLAHFPFSYQMHYEHGLWLADSHRLEAAQAAFLKALKRYPFDAYAHLALAHVLEHEERTLSASLAFMTVALLRPNTALGDTAVHHLNALAEDVRERGWLRVADSTGQLREAKDLLGWDALAAMQDFDAPYRQPRRAAGLAWVGGLLNGMAEWPWTALSPAARYYQPYRNLTTESASIARLAAAVFAAEGPRSTTRHLAEDTLAHQRLVEQLAGYFAASHQHTRPDSNGLVRRLRYNLRGELVAVGREYEGQPIGRWLYFHPNLELAATGTFNRFGQRVEEWTYYRPDGSLQLRENYHYGTRADTTRHYFRNGQLRRLEPIEFGLPQDTITTFTPRGRLHARIPVDDGRRHGRMTQFFPSGRISATRMYRRDSLWGATRRYYRNGQLREEQAYLNGMAHGTYRRFSPTGKLREQGHFTYNEIDSTWERFDAFGTRQRRVQYAPDGRREAFYFPDGRLQATYSFRNNALEGSVIHRHLNGQVAERYEYKADRLVAYVHRDSSGERLSAGGAGSGTFLYEHRSKGGVVLEEGRYEQGRHKGEWIRRYRDGSLRSRFSYRNGLRHGLSSQFFPDGTLEMHYKTRFNRREGDFYRYHPTGEVAEAGRYREGRREGQWLRFWPDGTRRALLYYAADSMRGRQLYRGVGGQLRRMELHTDTGLVRLLRGPDEHWHRLPAGTGTFRLNFSDGQAYRRVPFRHGWRDGTALRFFPGGDTAEVVAYRHGHRHGPYRQWGLTPGQLRIRGQFAHDERTGLWEWYDPAGQLEALGRYANGLRHGDWLRVQPGGAVLSRTPFFKGERHGKAVWRLGEGREFELHWQYGRLFRLCWRDSCQDVTPFRRQLVLRYAGGDTAAVIGLRLQQLHGRMKLYAPADSGGRRLYAGYHFFNQADSVERWYGPAGRLLRRHSFLQGEQHGRSWARNPETGRQFILNYRNGLRHGPARIEDPKGASLVTFRCNNDAVLSRQRPESPRKLPGRKGHSRSEPDQPDPAGGAVR